MTRPPRIAVVLMGVALPGDKREAVLGDLHEEFQARAETDPITAHRWYWGQTVGSVFPLLVHRVGSARGPLVAGLGSGALATISFLVLAALSVLLFSRIEAPGEIRLFTYLGCAFAAGAVGGFHCRRRVRGGTAMAASMPILLVLTLFALSPEQESAAVGIIWILVILGGTRAGQSFRPIPVAS